METKRPAKRLCASSSVFQIGFPTRERAVSSLPSGIVGRPWLMALYTFVAKGRHSALVCFIVESLWLNRGVSSVHWQGSGRALWGYYRQVRLRGHWVLQRFMKKMVARCSGEDNLAQGFMKMTRWPSAKTSETGYWRFRHKPPGAYCYFLVTLGSHRYLVVGRPPEGLVGTGNSDR